MCWCAFALSFFFCVPLFVSWLSNFHFIFILISLVIPRSSSFSSHSLRAPPCRRQGVCVYRLQRRKTSSYYIILYYIWLGITGVPEGSVINEDTPPGPVKTYQRDCGGAPGLVATIVPYIYIYIHIYLTKLI